MSRVFIVDYMYDMSGVWNIMCVCDSLETAQREIRNSHTVPPWTRLHQYDDFRFQIVTKSWDTMATFVIREHDVVTSGSPKFPHSPENCESCETLVRHGFPDTEQVC